MIHVKKNEIIFKQNDEGDCAYIVESGQVLIYLTENSEEIPLSSIRPGEIFGEISLLDNQTRSASARAVENTTLHEISREQIMERVNDSDITVRFLIQILLVRFRNQNAQFNSFKPRLSLDNSSVSVYASNSTQTAIDKIKLELLLKKGLANKELRLYYQPIIDLETRKIIGAEALLRWHSDEEIVMPTTFIDVLEHSSIIVSVGEWIIEQACLDLKEFHTHHPNFVTSINISTRQILDSSFLDYLQSVTEKSSISPHNLKLEITERIMMEAVLAIEKLKQCRELGFPISIDDFGIGFASLQYLSQMPITDIKIDRNFVKKVTLDIKIQAIVKILISLARSLNIDIVSEGIENQNELTWLKDEGVRYGQGWLFSKAIPKDELISILKTKGNLIL